MTDTSVEFTKEAVTEYLDGCILHWRDRRDTAGTTEDRNMAACYVDAFQSVRSSLIGEELSVPDNGVKGDPTRGTGSERDIIGNPHR